RLDHAHHRQVAGDSPAVEAVKLLARAHQNLICRVARSWQEAVCDDPRMSTSWTFTVEDAFAITGYGVAVIGQVDGVIPADGPAVLCVRGVHRVIDRASVQMLDQVRDGRREGVPALLLHGATMDQLMHADATVHSVDAACRPMH
ncbi:hypothetical protein ABT297_40050, partial [Dactylosporangium sp. NPDC000555]|uniref:hypothetical protein n=1 Tax=Dactylosporangium sp. NPDC000555 TaxID=3154260 RepID=UPI003329E26D